MPQGDRCNGEYLACNEETELCEVCGRAAGQLACEGALSRYGARLATAQPLSTNAVCAETRSPWVDPVEGLRCPGQPPLIHPPRCVESVSSDVAGGGSRIASVSARNRFSGQYGRCERCGQRGEQCCESQLCLDPRDTCDAGTCVRCGELGDLCCRCGRGTNGVQVDGCVVRSSDRLQLACVGNPHRCAMGGG